MTDHRVLMGDAQQLRHMAADGIDHLNELIGELQTCDPSERAAVLQSIRTWQTMCRWILNDGAERVDRREAAGKRATERADAKVRANMQDIEAVALASGFNPKGYYVYMLVDAARKVLYVGQSENILSRLGSHLGDRRKYPKVASVHLIRCRLQREMMTLEADLITKHQPPWNTIGVVARWPSATPQVDRYVAGP